MIKNTKNLIMFGALALAMFGIFGTAQANMSTSNYPITDYQAYSSMNNNYNQGYYGNNYSNTNNSNTNNNGNTNTGYIPTNYSGYDNQSNQTQNVYGSDPSVPKPATVVSTNTSSTKTLASNTVKNTSSTKTVNNTKTSSDTSTDTETKNSNTVIGSGSDMNNNGNSIVALSAYGSDRFLPDTVFEWIMVFFLMLIVIILFRLIMKRNHHAEVEA